MSAWTVVKSPRVREPFFNWLSASEFNAPPIAAMVATQAAYEHGGPWLDQALEYLQANVDHAADFFARRLPQIKLYRPQASFTVWLDFKGLGLSREELVALLVERGHLALSEGSTFGAEGMGFMRMNIGVPRAILDEGLEHLAEAVDSLAAGQPSVQPSKLTNIPFVKMNGLGNDFVYVDCMERPLDNLPDLARQISRRHTGVGSDGIIAIMPGNGADCRMRIFNADGSEAQMCGNGIRCVAKYIYDNRLVSGNTISIETLSGIKTVEVHTASTASPTPSPSTWARHASSPSVSLSPAGREHDRHAVEVDGKELRLTAVSMGNPHGVVFVDSFDGDIVSELGPRLENHPIWPEKANIEFVRIDDAHNLSMRAWERGTGETMACGTGACAAAAAAVATGRAQWPVTMRLIGGNLGLDLSADGHIMMTAPPSPNTPHLLPQRVKV